MVSGLSLDCAFVAGINMFHVFISTFYIILILSVYIAVSCIYTYIYLHIYMHTDSNKNIK